MKLPEAIYCKTKEESRRIREIMHEQGLTWCDGKPFIDESNPQTPIEDVTYYPEKGTWGYTIDHEGGDTTPASEVIRQHKSEVESILTPGTIVKASKTGSDKYNKGRLVGFMKDGRPVIEFESGALSIFDNIEPYNEKEENIKKVKDLMADLGVMKEDL